MRKHMLYRLLAPCLALLLVITALPVTAQGDPGAEARPWWNDRVFYEIFVRSFYDSDGDGIGDLRGVIEKLDYLNDGDPTTTDDLGVTGLWLMPIAQSPSYHGYDVTDYMTIEEDYGTNEDFLALMDAAHERGMVVIVDLVLNHTSNQHPWFQASAAGDPDYADWYRWSDSNPNQRNPWGGPAWHRMGDRYYFGMFWSGMPDLNYETPAVTDAMNEVIRFWLEDMGADGFRLDAIRHLYESGSSMANLPATFDWLANFHTYVHTLNPDALTVGEIWDSTTNVVPYVGDYVDLAFEFDLAEKILQAMRFGLPGPLIDTQQTVLDLYPPGQYAAFLTNHDMDRVMSVLREDEGAARAAATILLTNPGVPFIYYGEEIGMQGTKPDEHIRTPMQWSDARGQAGFTTATPWEPLANGYSVYNVAAEADSPDSLLALYRELIALRNAHPALRTGDMQFVEADDSHLYAFLRYQADETLLVVINLDDEPVGGFTLSAESSPLSGPFSPELVLGGGAASAPDVDDAGGFSDYAPVEEIPAQSGIVLRLQ